MRDWSNGAKLRQVEIVNATKIRLLSSRLRLVQQGNELAGCARVDYEVLDVIRNDAAYNEMVNCPGRSCAGD